ncbi:hypothetical protein A7985_11585 [Pseudoalteromonas luteoviolacea]|uniref:Uncharacterized protein n=1 Tax=Pseudoalteromonas luteoviolacea TaxID=43657 RepID=A0A1C0TQN0_9GAMM|nr:hypothetical protein A7985_11585 [Pseudoalteromonas luteoviolacea]
MKAEQFKVTLEVESISMKFIIEEVREDCEALLKLQILKKRIITFKNSGRRFMIRRVIFIQFVVL